MTKVYFRYEPSVDEFGRHLLTTVRVINSPSFDTGIEDGETEGVLPDTSHLPSDKTSVLHYDISSDEIKYDVVNRPLSDQENISKLLNEVSTLKDTNDELLVLVASLL
jgi:hypothetical protein